MVRRFASHPVFHLRSVALCFALLLSASGLAATPTPMAGGTAQALDATVRALVGAQRTGVSVGVIHNGEVWFSAYGLADVEKGVKATPQTSYRLASITKTFTAVLAMQLVQEGKLALDTDIHAYLPQFPVKPWPITVRQLLGHLGGISHYRGLAWEHRLQTHHDTAQALALFQDWDLVAEPSTRFVYSTYGYNLLGAVVEKACGKSFEECLNDRIFGPLGMADTALEHPEARTKRWAVGYRKRNAALVRASYVDISSRFAGGGTRGTVQDLISYAQALLDEALLSRKSWREMTTAQVTRDGMSTDYGLGFGVYPQRGHFVISHSGGQPETATLLVLIPAEGFAIALASNLEENGSLLSEIATVVSEQLLDGGLRRRSAYAEQAADAIFYDGISRIQSYGMAAYSVGRDEDDDGSGFQAVSAMLSPESLAQPDARSRIQGGHQPANGAPFVRVGAEMAKRIAQAFGKERLAEKRTAGPLAFFSDYFLACEQIHCPPRAELSPAVKSYVDVLLPIWTQANSVELARIRLSKKTSRPFVQKLLLRNKASVIRPDLTLELTRLARELSEGGKALEARRWLQLGRDAYPESLDVVYALVESFLVTNELKQAKLVLENAMRNERMGLSLSSLNTRAEGLAKGGKAKAADALRLVGAQLFPSVGSPAPQ